MGAVAAGGLICDHMNEDGSQEGLGTAFGDVLPAIYVILGKTSPGSRRT